MAKNTFPFPVKSSGILSKVVGLLFALAILALVINSPRDAADWVRGLFQIFGDAIDGIGTFLKAVLG